MTLILSPTLIFLPIYANTYLSSIDSNIVTSHGIFSIKSKVKVYTLFSDLLSNGRYVFCDISCFMFTIITSIVVKFYLIVCSALQIVVSG